ncbi:MAG: phosphopantetheine-protein transferase [Verrucomicrobiales bacterium]|nr:phosphopantetheine-protein transferase [Verrucomicrobiales bacterium]
MGDVWLSSLDLPPGAFEECSSYLSADEKERAARFRFEEHRKHYAASRGLLRKLLAGYLNTKPENFAFSYNRYGKPLLDHLYPELSFNVSHSYGWALFGFTMGTELGVDIEKERPDFATMEIAERFFAPDEVDVLRSLPADLRASAFFHCWTRKEAFIKAHGMGLSMGLNKFAVAFAPDVPPALLRFELEPNAAKRWSICDLEVPQGYKGALAMKAAPIHVRRMRPAIRRESP